MTTAVGADALFGLSIEAPSDRYSVGHPGVNIVQLAMPTDRPAAAAGAAGALTGDFLWRYAFGKEDGSLTPGGKSSDAGATVPQGTPGLDDATFSGTYSGLAPDVPLFEVVIDAEATPDTFKWRQGGGAWTPGVACAVAPTLLADGISVAFGATTGHTAGDAWNRDACLTLSAKRASLTAIAVSPDAACTRRVMERSADRGVTWAVIGTLYDNTTTIFSDNDGAPDVSRVITMQNQTGANYGFLFVDVDAFDIDPDFTALQSAGLRGSAGRPRGIPGPIKIAGTPKGDVRAAYLQPILMAGCGGGTTTPLDGGAVSRTVWTATTGRRSPRTISVFTSDGSPTIPPVLLYNVACEELTVGFDGGKIVDTAFKLTGAKYGTCGPAAQDSGTGTWKGAFVCLGSRYDAKAATDEVYIKITQALSGQTVKFKVKVGAAATYDGAEYTLYTNAAGTKQVKGGAQFNDSIELFDETGLALGADEGSNRQPYCLIGVGGDFADLDVDDVFIVPLTAAIPGMASLLSPDPYSGVPAQYVDGPRFTDAHVTIRKGGSVIEAMSGSVKLSFPKKEVNSLNAGARNLQDLVNDGYFAAEVTITRLLDTAEWRDMMKTDDRAVVQVQLQGERIPINPGSLSTYREGLTIDIPQFVVKTTKAPKANQSSVIETVTGEAEQPDNPSNDLFTLTLYTRQTWRVPA